MNETKYAIVVDTTGYAVIIDAESYAKAFVLVDTRIPINDEDNAGEPVHTPEGYTMRDGEKLIYEDIQDALEMLKPRWTGTEWEETASPEEIQEWEDKKPPIPTLPPVPGQQFTEDEADWVRGLIHGVGGVGV